jgi:hypothetical protein
LISRPSALTSKRERPAAPQGQVVLPLDAGLAVAELGQLEQRIAVQLALGDGADVAQKVRRGAARRILPHEAGIEAHARQLRRPDRDPRHLLPDQILAHRDRHEGATRARLREHGIDAPGRQLDQLLQRAKRAADLAGLLGNDPHPVGRHVAGEGDAMAIEDAAARRRHEPVVDAILVGEQGVLVGLEHLQVVEAPGEQSDQAELAPGEQGRAPAERAPAIRLTVHAATSARGCAPDRATSSRADRARSSASAR